MKLEIRKLLIFPNVIHLQSYQQKTAATQFKKNLRMYHMNYLVVSIVSKFDVVPIIVKYHFFPLFLHYKSGCVHGPTIANDETIPSACFS